MVEDGELLTEGGRGPGVAAPPGSEPQRPGYGAGERGRFACWGRDAGVPEIVNDSEADGVFAETAGHVFPYPRIATSTPAVASQGAQARAVVNVSLRRAPLPSPTSSNVAWACRAPVPQGALVVQVLDDLGAKVTMVGHKVRPQAHRSLGILCALTTQWWTLQG